MSTVMQNTSNIDVGTSGHISVNDMSTDDIVVEERVGVSRSDIEVEDFGDEETSEESKSDEDEEQTYPPDCYSFIAVHRPWDKGGGFFFFGFFVWVAQMLFLSLMAMDVVSKYSTNQDTDNPDEASVWNFIPSNQNELSKTTQFMALLAYNIFADESLKDIVTAVETFPKLRKVQPGDKTFFMILSSVLRCAQGMLASVVVLLLVINTTDVIDLVLNFTAVNFISAFDDVAFELAQTGKYGPRLENEANRIEELPVPPCLYQKYKHFRYRVTVIVVSVMLLGLLIAVTVLQLNNTRWVTTRLRVQFKDDPLHEKFNGCYSRKGGFWDNRYKYESFETNEAHATFGYCNDDRKWYLYTGDKEDACSINETEKQIYSARTYTYDISAVQEETWYSRTGTPLEWYFFDDNLADLTDDECRAYLDDGICNPYFNRFDYSFDEGDCCGDTCEGLNCGRGALNHAFNTTVSSGNGFPNCIDPVMVPITILINDVYTPPPSEFGPPVENPFANADPLEPLMLVDCDGKNYLTVNVKQDMKSKMEQIQVADGATCEISIKNVTGGPLDINYVNYTVYHGKNDTVFSDDAIMILNEDSQFNRKSKFQRIRDCFITKLGDYLDVKTIYTGDSPSNKAVRWLMDDSLGFSNCLDEHFVERYALAAINYALPNAVNETEDNADEMKLWIDTERQCAWQNVACKDGSVDELDLGAASGVYLTGTLPTEIGLLENLARADFGNNLIGGSIPTEIGDWNNLDYFGVSGNGMTGTIPTEVGKLAKMEWFWFNENQFSGTIPSEIGLMTNTKGLFLWSNQLVGSIPDEIDQLSELKYFITGGNFLTGTLPSALGSFKDLTYLDSSNNIHTGTIPREYGKLTKLDNFQMGNNTLQGSLPVGLLNNTYQNFDFFGNALSGLTTVDGYEICEAGGGEVYCDCGGDCFIKKYQCGCPRAESCCATLYADRTPCYTCASRKVQNPTKYVEEFDVTCQEAYDYISINLAEFGTEETCAFANTVFAGVGCICDNDASPEDDVMQEAFGI